KVIAAPRVGLQRRRDGPSTIDRPIRMDVQLHLGPKAGNSVWVDYLDIPDRQSPDPRRNGGHLPGHEIDDRASRSDEINQHECDDTTKRHGTITCFAGSS